MFNWHSRCVRTRPRQTLNLHWETLFDIFFPSVSYSRSRQDSSYRHVQRLLKDVSFSLYILLLFLPSILNNYAFPVAARAWNRVVRSTMRKSLRIKVYMYLGADVFLWFYEWRSSALGVFSSFFFDKEARYCNILLTNRSWFDV